MWDGTNWVDNGINTNLVVGDMYKVAVPMAANGLTWTISGTTPPLGSAEYTLKSASNGNYNWITTPADMTDLANTTDLAKAMGAKIPGLSAWNDMLEVHTWDGANQVETPYLLLWDGTTWEDLGNNTSVRVPGAYIVAVPQKADGVLWP
jgi:hypothetical protein